MIHNLKPYPAYKDSGIPWLGQVPENWEVKRQRNIVKMLVSNVDKHVLENEDTVRLCNYTDVYKNDKITERITFMRATASIDEIRRFKLNVGDVIITKDSETWNDIAVPALVEYEAPDLICGYHLAILRPFIDLISGGYLFRALQSQGVESQYYVSANGVTRYGLSHEAIKSVLIPVPPLPEQSAIVRYLDYMDQRIRRYIHAKQKLIKLLEEQKQAIIHRSVTRGLDPNVKLKPSGVEWLGDVPEHWEIKPAKRYYREIDERSSSGSEELLSVSHLTGVTPRSGKNITMFMAESYVGYKLCRENDIVINTMWAWAGALGVSKQTGIVSYSYAVYRPIQEDIFIHQFIDLLLRTKLYVDEYTRRSTGIRSSRLRMYPEIFLRIPIICPPITEQRTILEYIVNSISNIEIAIQSAQREIGLLREYRTRLIADVVTGKLDVREAAASLPDEEEPEVLEDTSDESEEIMDIEHQERVYDLGDEDDA